MQFMFANYVKLLRGTSDGPVDTKTKNTMLPNVWQQSYLGQRNFQSPSSDLELLGLDDIAATHDVYRSPFWNGSKVLHIYRNPLDFCVSTYFFAYQYRTGKTDTVAGPVEVMDYHLDDYIVNYVSYRKVAKDNSPHLLRLTYEEMITHPERTFTTILEWLGVEPNPELVNLAAQYSSRDSIRKIEDRDGPIDTMINTPDARFVRDGSIGQWKKYFQEKDLDRVRSILARHKVTLDEFTLEAEQATS